MSTAAESLRVTEADPTERWMPVVGFAGLYEISDQGRVWSCITNRILVPGPQSKGYLCVSLYYRDRPKHCKSFCVHDLVMAAFVGPKPEGLQVDHGKEGKACNALRNLEYVTPLVNVRRAMATGKQRRYVGADHANSKLTPKQVRAIRRRGLTETRAALGKEFKVSPDTIRDVVLRRTYRNVT